MLFAHLKPEYLADLQRCKLGDFLPHPLPVCNLGFHVIEVGYDFHLDLPVNCLMYGYNIDNSRLSEDAIKALFSANWHRTVREILDRPYFISTNLIHHLSL